MSDLVIRPVTTAADRKRFVDLVWEVYKRWKHSTGRV